jgi:hypothetical protein
LVVVDLFAGIERRFQQQHFFTRQELNSDLVFLGFRNDRMKLFIFFIIPKGKKEKQNNRRGDRRKKVENETQTD